MSTVADPTERAPCAATTARGTPCKLPAVPGLTVCTVHAGAPVGRPTKLSAPLVERMLQVLRAGGYIEAAAAVAGIGVATFYRWLERGDPAGTEPDDEPYRDLRRRVEQARAESETRNVALIAQAAATDWHAAAWLLERQHEHWRRPAPRSADSEAPPSDVPDPLDALDAQVVPIDSRRRKA